MMDFNEIKVCKGILMGLTIQPVSSNIESWDILELNTDVSSWEHQL